MDTKICYYQGWKSWAEFDTDKLHLLAINTN